MPKQRRAIRRQFIIVLAIVLIGIVSVFKIPSFLISRNLGDLGYDKEAQKAIDALTNLINSKFGEE